MAHNSFTQNPLRVLSDEAVGKIHAGAVSLLERVGVRIDCDEALSLLAGCGVRCDLKKKRAYPDEASIKRALGSVRRGYKLYGRKSGDPGTLDIDTTTTHTISCGAALKLYDGGSYRDATRNDLIDMTVLHEKLEHIDILINVVEPPEMTGPHMYPEIAAEMFCYSSKPLLLQANGARDVEKLLRMGALLVGGVDRLKDRPVFMTGTNAESPLSVTKEGAEVLITGAREGIPVSLGAYVMAGATAPLDVAGAIVQRTATVLCGLVLTQAAQPGSVYDASAQAACCDLATGDVVTMSPQVMQLVAGSIQMGRHYGLVTNALSATESKAPDAQAAGERFFSLCVSVMAGASLIHGATSEMSGMELADFAQCVIDDEIAGYVLDFAGGVGTDGLEEAVGVIEEVVEDPQYAALRFLGHPHTAERCRRAGYGPDLFSIGMLSRWIAGKKGALYDRAQARAGRLIAEREEFVPPDLKKELFKIARG